MDSPSKPPFQFGLGSLLWLICTFVFVVGLEVWLLSRAYAALLFGGAWDALSWLSIMAILLVAYGFAPFLILKNR